MIQVLASLATAADLNFVIDSAPQGATVVFDGQVYGSTPLSIPMPSFWFRPATYGWERYLTRPISLVLYKDGYDPKAVTLSVGPLPGGMYYIPFTTLVAHLDPVATQPTPAPSTSQAPRPPRAGPWVQQGSGFHVWAPGLVATAAHVLTPPSAASGAEVVAISRNGLDCVAEVVSVDSLNDVALLRVDTSCQEQLQIGPPLPLADHPPRMGDDTLVIGFPSRLGDRPAVSAGIVRSMVGSEGDARRLTISNAAAPGNSGGPVIGADGAVLGVLVSVTNDLAVLAESGLVGQQSNFAVKAGYLSGLMDTASQASAATVAVKGDSMADRSADLERRVVMVLAGSKELRTVL